MVKWKDKKIAINKSVICFLLSFYGSFTNSFHAFYTYIFF